MDDRQRFLRTVLFQDTDRLPLRHAYGLMPGVLETWHDEGLPTSVQTREQIYEYFGFPTKPIGLPLRSGPIPPIEPKVIEDTDERRVAVDGWGRKTHMLKKVTTLPLAVDFPVKDWDSWLDLKRRLVPGTERVGDDLEETAAENVRTGHTNVLGGMGFYWFPRDLMGDENLAVAYYEQPDLVHDINETWCSLIEYLLSSALERINLDVVHFGEDMAYRNASMIGPGIFDEFVRPYYERIHAIVDRYEIPVFSVDSDGCVNELIHWFASCGVNMIGPNEVQAGNDIVSYRRQFGKSMAYDGGLDKRELVKGREAIDAMLERTIPPMKESGGGWIMCLDHRVVPGTRLADFQYYVDRARELGTY